MTAATIHTDFGNMTLEFFPDKAPNHVSNFLELAEAGFYDGLKFHRIVDGFMIQGGCPKGTGAGGGPRRLAAEFNDTPHVLGTLSMARSADPDSASSQFFICLAPAPFLDGKYSAFGQLADDESRTVLKQIGKVPCTDPGRGECSAPVDDVIIRKVVVNKAD